MGDKHGAHQTDEAYVVSLCEDYCRSPTALVGYMISQTLNMSTLVCGTVNGCGTPVLNMSSLITHVTGNEAGIGGGAVSGVNLGMCKPVEGYASKVRAEGQCVLRHETIFEMNMAGPTSDGNVKGKLILVKNSKADTLRTNKYGGKHYSAAEVVDILRDIEDKSLAESFFDHFGGGAYDFKINEPTATFDVVGVTMNSGEFGNFLAGYAGQVNGLFIGEMGVRAGGILYDAVDAAVYDIADFFGKAPALPPGTLPPKFDFDMDSKPAIDLGVNFGKIEGLLEVLENEPPH